MNIDKWGIELEFNMSTHIDTLNATELRLPSGVEVHRYEHDHETKWTLGTDSSASATDKQGKYCHGFELRTPIFEQFPYDDFKHIIGVLKRHQGGCRRATGIHIHFSNSAGLKNGFMPIAVAALKAKYGKCIKKKRKTYCEYEDGSKYSVIHKVEFGHCEARIFNSTLNIHGVYDYWKSLKKILEVI